MDLYHGQYPHEGDEHKHDDKVVLVEHVLGRGDASNRDAEDDESENLEEMNLC